MDIQLQLFIEKKILFLFIVLKIPIENYLNIYEYVQYAYIYEFTSGIIILSCLSTCLHFIAPTKCMTISYMSLNNSTKNHIPIEK